MLVINVSTSLSGKPSETTTTNKIRAEHRKDPPSGRLVLLLWQRRRMESSRGALPGLRTDGRRPCGLRCGLGAQIPVHGLCPQDNVHGYCECGGQRADHAEQRGTVGQSESGGRLHVQFDLMRKRETDSLQSEAFRTMANTWRVHWFEN
jgi:hypothetical protein